VNWDFKPYKTTVFDHLLFFLVLGLGAVSPEPQHSLQ
jgi:hypothetical protein